MTESTPSDLPFSTSQIRKAGDRIRRAAERGEAMSARDREILDAFRAWHQPTLERVQEEMVALFHKTLELDPATYFIGGRPLKTVEAITAKLVRGKTRLHKMQDIAGTRIVVPTLEAQEIVMEIVLTMFGAREGVVAKDTREKGDQWGYRAVHIVARLDGRLAEVQVRTKNQDSWAQVVESIDRSHRWDLKHGNGPTDWIEWLITLSDALRERDLGRPAPLPPDPYERLLENEKEGGSTE